MLIACVRVCVCMCLCVSVCVCVSASVRAHFGRMCIPMGLRKVIYGRANGAAMTAGRHAGTDAFLMESIFRNEAWGHMLEPVSQDNEAAVCESMVAGCEAALSAFTTSLAEDIRALDELGGVMSARAVALRVLSVRTQMHSRNADLWCVHLHRPAKMM